MNRRFGHQYNTKGSSSKKKIFFLNSFSKLPTRLEWLVGGFVLFSLFIFGKLFSIAILDHPFYVALAEDQHEVFRTLVPQRGSVYASDKEGTLFALAAQKEFYHIYAIPHEIDNASNVARQLFPFIYPEEPEEEIKEEKEEQEEIKESKPVLSKAEKELRDKNRLDALENRLSKVVDPYEPLMDRVTREVKEMVEQLQLPGIHFLPKSYRYYPEEKYAGQLTGFLGKTQQGELIGQYGIEGYFNKELSGNAGYIETEKDATGRWITLAEKKFMKAEDGADIILTIDKHIQYVACEELYKSAEELEATGGAVIVANPQTGAILAMCSYPYFDPNMYGQVDGLETYNNRGIFNAYEPGSIFKSITMAIALDKEVITPETTYDDEGEIKIGTFTIRNSDKKAHGVSTMTDVLEKSLNLGTIFVAMRVGNEEFVKEVKRFGFGDKTGISLDYEHAGQLGSLEKERDIYTATASYGQGITVTPLQMIQAYGAIANGGKLMKPYIVDQMRKGNDILYQAHPELIREVISEKTSTILSGMLVSVLKKGHGSLASVKGYYLAGKTGTAQVASQLGGYEKDATIHSFVGYGPVDHPSFVMITRLDRPQGVVFAEQSAAPLFSRIASYILQYYQIPKDY